MALDNKMRNRLGNNGGKFAGRQTNRGASGRPNSRFVNRGAGPSGIQDAREVLQAKTHRRIMRTPSGLLTTRKANGITTSQLRNRQMRPTSARVGAAIRKSAVINSNPLLQTAVLWLNVLLPMDSGFLHAPEDANANPTRPTPQATDKLNRDRQSPKMSHTVSETPRDDENSNIRSTSGVNGQRAEFDWIKDSLERDIGGGGGQDVVEDTTEEERDSRETDNALNSGNGNSIPQQESEGTVSLPKKEVKFGNEVAVPIESEEDDDTSEEEKNSRASDEIGDLSDVDDYELPSTCKVLIAPNGSTLYLVGTAHFSKESQNDVRRVIRKVKPERVVVELCKQRIHILTVDEKYLLSEASKLTMQTIRDTIKKMGVLQGAMFLLMMQMSVQLTNKLKMAPGGEFRVAFQEAQKLRDCQVFLGDRELNVTLKRAWAGLGVWQRVKIIYSLLTTTEDISAEEVEKCKEKDMLEQLLGEMCADYPDLSRVLLTERDLYLCRSVFDMTKMPPSPVNIVAVVGIGHQKGIEENWNNAEEIDLCDLARIPQPSMGVRVTGTILRLGFWAGIGYASYRMIPHRAKEAIHKGVETGLKVSAQNAAKIFNFRR